MKSMSDLSIPDRSMASFAALVPIDDVESSGPANRRSFIPVRSVIQSSFVSIVLDKSLFVTMLSGT